MRSACVRLFADAVIACKDFMRSARVQLLDYTFVYCQSGVRVVGAYLDWDLRVVGDRCKAASGS